MTLPGTKESREEVEAVVQLSLGSRSGEEVDPAFSQRRRVTQASSGL